VSQKAAAAPEPEEIAGRYQVIKRLGAGAFGTVYKVKDKVLGRMLAIKTIRLEGLAASGASIEELMDRFKREAQISAQLRHPNIVTIYDVGESEGMSYLAMEFIDGVGLDRVIAAAGRLPLERAALIAAQVADALDFAHRHNVVHRDIKPANIMIEAGDRVKVTDFGIAKVTDSGEHLTMTGSLLGTPSYMSPEQAKGATLDGRSDLFAVGAILYEMLAGQKAFRGDSITGLIFKIITEEPQLITELDPTLPADMVQVVQRALSKAPEARYQSGRSLAEDLLAFSRPGSSPTLRQGEIDTMRGGGVAPATPTVSGASPTMAGAPTQGRAPATQVAPPGAVPAAPPRPVEPTYLVSAGAPPPPAVDPTYLVGTGRGPAPAAPPRPPVAAPPPYAAAPPPYAAAAPAAAPRAPQAPLPAAPPVAAPRTARVAQSQSSALLPALIAVGVLGLAGLGGGAWWYLNRDKGTTTADAGTGTSGTASPGTGAATSTGTGSGTTIGSPGPVESAGSTDVGTTGTGTTTAGTGTGTGTAGTGTAGSGTAGTAGSGTATTGTGNTGTGNAGAGTAGTGTAGTGRTGSATGTSTGPATTGSGAGRSADSDLSILDQEPPELSGRQTGASVADTYRSNRGWGNNSGGSFGASGRLNARPRAPRDLTTHEKRAAVVLLNMLGLEAVHKRRTGSYGSFQEIMPVPVNSPNRFDRGGYRFDLKVESDGFTIMATSTSGRALQVDDSGFVTYVD
jgi:hypothetical protein